MLLALTRREVASFLEVDQGLVEIYWANGDLKKSLCGHDRFSSELAASSIYDVIEFVLVDGSMGQKVERDDASLWLDLLARLSDCDSWAELDFEARYFSLLSDAYEEGLTSCDEDAAERVACICVAAQYALATTVYEAEQRLVSSEGVLVSANLNGPPLRSGSRA